MGRLREARSQATARADRREQDERKTSLLYNVIFNALLEFGTERTYAIELVADAAWRVYRLWSAVALGLARVTPGKTTSLAFAVTNPGEPRGRVSLSFPFNAPGYLIEAVPADSGTAFDVVRCPMRIIFVRVVVQPRLCACRVELTRNSFAPRHLFVAMIGVTFD